MSVLGPVQALRAVAASMVVLTHSASYVVPKQQPLENIGTLGVAIFFIISGFIMFHTTSRHWSGDASVSRKFVARRLHRIVPLYWLVTTLMAVLVLIANDPLSIRELILSYLFIPFDFDGVKFRPLLGVGWTLDFEMFFYALFALALLLPKQIGLPALLAVLTVLGISGMGALAQPIILLFGVGIILGWLRERYPFRMHPSLLPLLFTPLLLVDDHPSQLVFLPGIWALAFVWAVPALFAPDKSKVGKFSLWLGDASYLLYPSHPLVILCLTVLAKYAGLTSTPEKIGTAIVMFFGSIAVAMIGHVVIEKPLLARAVKLRPQMDQAELR